jgi:hypothetical protein
VVLSAAWWGRWEDYGPAWAPWSGFLQRAEARVNVPLGPRVRLGAGWSVGRDDTAVVAKGWTEHGPRADLRVVLGPTTRLVAEVGAGWRRYHAVDAELTDLAPLGLRLEERYVEGAAALERDVGRKLTLRLSLGARASDANHDAFDYAKAVPSVALGLMMSP